MMLAALVGMGAVATYTDLRTRLIPNWLTGTGVLGVLVWRIATGTGATGLAGAGMALAVLGLASLASRHPPGGGDWKYAVVLGGALGPGGALVTLGVTAVLSSGAGAVQALRHGTGWHTPLPLGPFLAAGSCLVAVGMGWRG